MHTSAQDRVQHVHTQIGIVINTENDLVEVFS